MAISLTNGWTAASLAPKTSGPAPARGPVAGGLQLPGVATPSGIDPVTGMPSLMSLGKPVSTPNQIFANAPNLNQVPTFAPIAPPPPPNSPAGFGRSTSGDIPFSNSTYKAPVTGTTNPLYAELSKILGLPSGAGSPTASAQVNTSVPNPIGTPTRMPNQAQSAAPGTAPTPTYNNATSAYQNPNIPAWMQQAVDNLNNYDSYNRTRASNGAGGYDPLIGQTMAATEERLAAQQKAQQAADKARVAQAQAEAAANAHAQQVQIQHQKYISPIGQGGGGWSTPNYGGGFI